MKKTPFKVSISRYHGNNTGIRFQIESLSGGIMFCFDMDLKTFAECITGLGCCETEIGEIYGDVDRVHKTRIHKSFRVKSDFKYDYKTRDEELYNQLLEIPEVKAMVIDGWDLHNRFNTQGDINKDGVMAKFSKWVPYDQIPEEYLPSKTQYDWEIRWHEIMLKCIEESKSNG